MHRTLTPLAGRRLPAAWPVFAAVAAAYLAYYGAILAYFAVGYAPGLGPAHAAIYTVVRVLYALGVPAWFLYFPAIWLTAVLAPALGPALWAANALLLLGAVAWLARRQPTARRARLVAGVLAAWLLIAPLLMAIQAWTPIAIDELF